MITNRELICSVCGESAVLETTNIVDEWPRELNYLCPNGHRHLVIETSNPALMPPPPPTNPDIPVKFKYRVSMRKEQEVELYQICGNFSRKFGKTNVQSYLNLLEDYINGAIIQYHRIQESHELALQAFTKSYQHLFEKSNPNLPFTAQWILILDVHFYLICVDKIYKLCNSFLASIAPLARQTEGKGERRIIKRSIEHKLNELKIGKDVRDFLEHVEEKIQKGDFEGLNLNSDETGSILTGKD